MPRTLVMVIRHAEKPSEDGSVCGVTPSGAPSADELSVRGWQRAGALVRFFAASHQLGGGIARPSFLFAPGVAHHVTSVRARSTLTPLSDLIGIPVCTRFLKGQEMELAAAVTKLEGVVLIAWEHNAIIDFAARLTGGEAIPAIWPDDRFDMVWSFEREDASWRFSQVPQLLLVGDSEAPI